MSGDPRRRYLSLPEYRKHPGCSHPVNAHQRDGCLIWNCRCITPRSTLIGRSGCWSAADWALRIVGALWLLGQAWDFVRWLLSGG